MSDPSFPAGYGSWAQFSTWVHEQPWWAPYAGTTPPDGFDSAELFAWVRTRQGAGAAGVWLHQQQAALADQEAIARNRLAELRVEVSVAENLLEQAQRELPIARAGAEAQGVPVDMYLRDYLHTGEPHDLAYNAPGFWSAMQRVIEAQRRLDAAKQAAGEAGR